MGRDGYNKTMTLDIRKTALVIVDVQNDFCPAHEGKNGRRPDGALAVPGAENVIGPLNALAAFFSKNGGKIIASQDWHPAGHVSFASSHGKKIYETVELPVSPEAIRTFRETYPKLDDQPLTIRQILWPDHCVENTPGAAFHDALETGRLDFVVRKGRSAGLDSYSVFFENDRMTPTELHGRLKEFSVDTLVFGGLATDFCVLYSVLDSLRLGYKTFVAGDAIAGVNVPPGSAEAAEKTMKTAGAVFAPSGDFLP